MKKVTIKKQLLIAKITENLAKHDQVYSEAVTAYWKDVTSEFDRQVTKAKGIIAKKDISNGSIHLNIHISAPDNNREAYEDALEMLNYEIEKNVVLSPTEFNSYVLNKWSWSDQFLLSNARYATKMSLDSFKS